MNIQQDAADKHIQLTSFGFWVQMGGHVLEVLTHFR